MILGLHKHGIKPLKQLIIKNTRRSSKQLELFKSGKSRKLMGLGFKHFTEIVGAGPVKNCDILGLGMFDACEIRIHPTGSAIARLEQFLKVKACYYICSNFAPEIGIPGLI
ncbi:MAG: hypothetical protein CM15mP114_07990 [Alphaproteobacteria bacterium]|nr:MAG: hypothetical protein CM15mP114_07990 [Alphaproteobacteria bacterium]